jgi:hypothetical protein
VQTLAPLQTSFKKDNFVADRLRPTPRRVGPVGAVVCMLIAVVALLLLLAPSPIALIVFVRIGEDTLATQLATMPMTLCFMRIICTADPTLFTQPICRRNVL